MTDLIPPAPRQQTVVLGTSSFGQPERAFPVYDAYWSAGGRAFDTAWLYGFDYGPGCCERAFGEWADSRGLNDEVWVLAKGAHTPECSPDRIEIQLDESLDRMRRGDAAMYMLHRDNEDVPVGEFVTALVDLVKRGVIGGYGMSNWTLPRLRAAVGYAGRHGLPAPSGVSNQFSLVEMVNPIYPGTISANTPDWRSWLESSGVVLYPWASQGRGCHAVADDDELRTGPLARSWYSEANLERVRRTRLLAERWGVSPTGLALAWTRSRPFPVSPLIGPRQVDEVHDSMAALDLVLDPAASRWLETGEGDEPR
ncbi:aldo/keto reductase [Actinokineospora spheciospongiae]|uniref:aldo/keto reductase n=1 Tax=Actinokineospora spheciospongiae TaxID=909613 RepID=UPI000D715540|nr:aldo/keto reductase [Actinokineospora spheciospongiae]PWW60376.1 aryl-alcohol dehydrogenase-like predicted oxidoreductase [Actinokineospora spheciospongiae]